MHSPGPAHRSFQNQDVESRTRGRGGLGASLLPAPPRPRKVRAARAGSLVPPGVHLCELQLPYRPAPPATGAPPAHTSPGFYVINSPITSGLLRPQPVGPSQLCRIESIIFLLKFHPNCQQGRGVGWAGDWLLVLCFSILKSHLSQLWPSLRGKQLCEPAGLPLPPVRPSPLDRAAVAQTCPRSLGLHRAGETVA